MLYLYAAPLAALLCVAGEAAAQNAPAKPTGFTATNTTTGADLAWTDPGDSTITGYEHRRKEAVKGSWGSWTAIANSGATTVSHSVTGSSVMEPRLGKGYTFQIRAVNANGKGAASDEKTALLNGICDRTDQVEKAILDAINDPPGTTPPISPQKTCDEVTYADITNFETNKNPQYTVKGLYIGNLEIGSLKTIDFYGLKKIRRLDIDNNDLTALPANVFDGLTLTHLVLPFNDIATLAAGTFAGARIEHIDLRENELTRLPETLFQGTIKSTLKELRFFKNRISGLPKNIFKGLTKLEDLDLTANRLTGLPRGIFKDQSRLETLSFMSNTISALPYDVFKPLTALTELSLNNNRLWCLPYIPNDLDPSLGTGKIPANYPPCLPGKPVSLSATGIHEGLWADWDHAGHPTGGLDVPETYTVQWRAGSAGTWSERTLPGNTTDLTISPLTNGTAYQVRVRATNSLGESSWTSPVTGTPSRNGMTLTPAGGSVEEGGSLIYTVKLNVRPTADVTVTITRTGDSDLKVDTDTNTPGFQNTLTFTPEKYHAPQLVVLTADDDADGADGAAVFTHTASGGGYNNVTATMNATEADDDGALTLSTANVTVTEGGTATYTVVLDAKPGDDVTVTVARNAGGDGDLTADTDPNTTGNQNTLTFTTTDWDTAQTVTLSARQDDDGLSGSATFTNTAAGGGYDGESATLTATEKDDDAALNLTPASVTVQEGGQAAYTVVLSHRPTGTVTVTVARASGDANLTVRVGSSLTFKTSDWNVPQTVVIAAAEDGDALNGAAVFAHTATGGGFSGTTAQLTATEADNERGIVFSPTSVTVPEGGTRTYTVKLETRPVGNVTVTVARTSGDGDLTADTDSNQTGDQNTLTFTTTDWNTAQTVTLAAAPDNDNANDEAVFTHTARSGGYGGVSAALTATEADDELGFKFSKLRVTVKESEEACTAANPTYTVKLSSQPSTCDVVVTVYKQTTCTNCDDDIKIDTNLDKVGDQNTLTFTYGPSGNWDTAQPVCLTAVGDADGIDGTAEITHWANQSCLGTFDGVNAKVTATEADKNRYLISTSGSTGEVPEGDGKTWTVKLGSQPTADVTVTVTRELGGDPAITVDTDPTDTDVDTTMTFTRTTWNTPQSFKVSAIEDDDAEHETVKFSFVPAGGGYGSGDAYDVTFSTRDNDDLCPKGEVTAAADCPALFADISAESLYVPEGGTASITVRLTARPSTDQTLTITEAFSFPGYYNSDTTVDTDPTTAGNQNTVTFTSANWSTPQTVTFATEEDGDEIHYRETFRFTLPSYDYADLYVTESDNDILVLEDLSDPTRNELTVPEAGEASFKVKLSAAPTSELTVKVVRRTGAAHDVDLTVKSGASLTFTTTDWDTAQTVTLQAEDDSDSRHGTAAFDLEGTYALHNGLTDFHVGALATVTAKESDDDFQVTLSKTEATVLENGVATYTVVLGTQPAANVSVVVARKSGGDSDLVADTDSNTAGDQDTLTFTTTNYDTPQTVTLRADDDVDAENGSAVFTHTATGGGYLQQVVEELTATEADDDRVVFEPTAATVPEGGTATYTVKLGAGPTGDVTVTVARKTGGDADLTADTDPDTEEDQNTLTFTTTNWDTAQTVTLRAAEDRDYDNGSAVFMHTATGGGYDGTAGELTATESDNDQPPAQPPAPVFRLTLSPAAVTVPEGGTATYTLKLAAAPTGTVTVTVSRKSGDGDLVADTDPGTTGDQNTLTFTTTNWNTAQTVTLRANDDADSVNGSAVFTHTATGGGYNDESAELTATEEDNDRDDRIAQVNETILPEVLQAAAQTTVNNVAARMAWHFSENTPVPTRSVEPVEDLSRFVAETLAAHGESLEDGTFSWRAALGATEFAIPLSAASGAKKDSAAGLALWGAGEYRSLAGDDRSIEWEGDLFSAHLGIEKRLRPHIVAGLGLSWDKGSFDYDYHDDTTGKQASGTQKLRMTSLYPYVGRSLGDRSDVWATIGYGVGEVEVDDSELGRQTADARQMIAAVGGTVRLSSDEGVLFEAGSTALDLKAETWAGRADVNDNGERIRGLTVSAYGLRVALEGREAVQLDSGAAFEPSLELGARMDGGDGMSGAGLEVGAGVGWTDPALGLTLRLRSRALLVHQKDYREWGVSGAFRFDPGADGRGLSLVINQSLGDAESGVDALWERSVVERQDGRRDTPGPRVGAELGYGVAGPADLGGELTFYTGIELSAEGDELYRIGARCRRASNLSLSLEGNRMEGTTGAVDHGVLLRVRLSW